MVDSRPEKCCKVIFEGVLLISSNKNKENKRMMECLFAVSLVVLETSLRLRSLRKMSLLRCV